MRGFFYGVVSRWLDTFTCTERFMGSIPFNSTNINTMMNKMKYKQ